MHHLIRFLLILLASSAVFEKARGHNIILNWDASASPVVAGYDVYYGTTSGIYPYKVDAGDNLSVTISNLTPGLTYFFAATAYDAAGDESPFSSEVSYIVPGTPTISMGIIPSSPTAIQFPAQQGHWYEVQATTDFSNWISIWQSGVAVSDSVMSFTDPDAGSFAARFYRLVMH